jgi:hypothetical protein
MEKKFEKTNVWKEAMKKYPPPPTMLLPRCFHGADGQWG